MIVQCKKDTLINNINIVAKAVSVRSTMPILECILLNADEKGFRLLATDLEIGIETSNMEAEIQEKGSVALEAKLFSEIIRSLPNEDVYIETNEKNLAVIKSGKSEFKILGQNGNDFPVLPNIEKNEKYIIETAVLRNMIKQTIFSVAVESAKPVLTGELIEINDNGLTIVAIDGFRVSYRNTKMENKNEDISAVVPAKALAEISKIASDKDGDIAILYFTENHVLFEMKNCIVVSRLLEGEFLRYEQIFNNDFSTVVKINKTEFLNSLERSMIMSKDSKKTPVKIQVMQENIIITANTEFGELYEEVPVMAEGSGLEIAFNPRYIIDALKAIEDEEVSVSFMSALSPCIIKGIDKEDYKYLILPLRLKD